MNKLTHADAEVLRLTARRGLLLVLVVSCLFFASWWNRYSPPTSGGEAVLMTDLGARLLPYRDYFFQAPPGFRYWSRAIRSVAGPSLLATLTFGALLRIASACALYGLLLRLSRPSFAAVATLTALFVSSTDIADTPFYYNHLGAALIVTGTYLGALAASGNRLADRMAGVSAGALIAFSIAVKQTMVFGATGAAFGLIVLALPRPKSGWAIWLLSLCAGGVIAIAGVWGWLAQHELLGAWHYAMAQAPQGKGGVVQSLFRPLTLLPSLAIEFRATFCAWMVLATVALLWRQHTRGKRVPHELLVVAAGLAAWSFGTFAGIGQGRGLTLFLSALGWWGGLALALLYLDLAAQDRCELCGQRGAGNRTPLICRRILVRRVLAAVRERRVSGPCGRSGCDARTPAYGSPEAMDRHDPRSGNDGDVSGDIPEVCLSVFVGTVAGAAYFHRPRNVQPSGHCRLADFESFCRPLLPRSRRSHREGFNA